MNMSISSSTLCASPFLHIYQKCGSHPSVSIAWQPDSSYAYGVFGPLIYHTVSSSYVLDIWLWYYLIRPLIISGRYRVCWTIRLTWRRCCPCTSSVHWGNIPRRTSGLFAFQYVYAYRIHAIRLHVAPVHIDSLISAGHRARTYGSL